MEAESVDMKNELPAPEGLDGDTTQRHVGVPAKVIGGRVTIENFARHLEPFPDLNHLPIGKLYTESKDFAQHVLYIAAHYFGLTGCRFPFHPKGKPYMGCTYVSCRRLADRHVSEIGPERFEEYGGVTPEQAQDFFYQAFAATISREADMSRCCNKRKAAEGKKLVAKIRRINREI